MKKILKKAVNVAVAVIMVASIVMVQTPSVLSAGNVNPWGEPSVECWTDSLTDVEGDSIFNLKSSDNGGNWKELQFGAYNPSGEEKMPVNWYIANAGTDSVDLLAYALQGSSGEENFLKPFGSSVFNDHVFDHNLNTNLGGTNLEYVESGVSVTDVYANHYGASKIRSRLNNEDDGLIVTAFTAEERDMMNPTPITIVDYKNTKDGERMHYTVSDKLYLAIADKPGDKIIKLGSGGRVEVPLGAGNRHPFGIDNPVDSMYGDFWLAGAEPDPPYALIADTKNHLITESGYVTTDLGFFPACNLNLESALFFSAAPVEVSGTSAVGELSGNQPFIIRHDGTEVAALADASVKYDNVRIQAKAGSAGPAILVVQWHDGSKDYYFEKCLATGESVEVTFSDLVVASGCTVGTLSEDCKVWLEYTDTTSNLTYAKPGDCTIHNITYVLNDGGDKTTSNPNPASYEEGDEIELADATRTGYTFDGWYEDENLNTRIEKIESTRTGKLKLYAKWTKSLGNTHTVTWKMDDGSVIDTTQVKDGACPAHADAVKEGYVFTGWTPAFSAVTADTTYKATFYGPVHTPILVDGSAAACTENGYKDYYKCGGCDKLFSDPACTAEISNLDTWKNGDGKIAATGHNAISIPGVPATEDKDGLHTYYYCGRCEKYFDDAECTNEITDLESWKQGAGRIPSGSGHTHDFNATSYIWHDGCGECTAYHTCTAATCGFTEMETVRSTKSDDTYTAAFSKERFEEQTKTITPEHIHTFSEDWSKNESVHWHAATCDHHDLSKGIEAHQYGGDNICNICGYEKANSANDPTVTPTPTVKPDATVTPTLTVTPDPTVTPTPTVTPDAEQPRKEYKMLDGESLTSNKVNGDAASFRSEGALENFTEVQVDRKTVETGNYTVEKGSTIVTFKPEYIKTLKDGEHTVWMVFTDGYSVAKWNIVSQDTPSTGDARNMAPFVLLLVATGAVVVKLLARRRRNCKNVF